LPLIPLTILLECNQRSEQQEYQNHVHIMPTGVQRGIKSGPGPQKACRSAEGVEPGYAHDSTEVCSANLRTRTELVSLQRLQVTQNMPQSQWMDRHMRWVVSKGPGHSCAQQGETRDHLTEGMTLTQKAGEGSSRPLTTGWARGNFPQPNEKICHLSLLRVLPFFE